MKILRRLRVRNLVTYEAADIDLTAAPVTVVRGRNFDRQNKKSANAVGKSLLFSTIPTLLFAKPPTADKNKSAKDLYLHQNGTIELDVQSNGHEYGFAQYVKGAGTLAYRVSEDVRDLNYNKAAEAISKMREAFPLTEEQFYAFVYLDSRNYHVLQRGTSSERFEFFQNIFNLGIYEVIAKSVGKRYTAVRDQLRDLKTYRTEFAAKRSELKVDRAAYNQMEAQIKGLQNQLGQAQTKLSGWYSHLQLRQNFLFLTEDLDEEALRWPLDMMISQRDRRKNQYLEMQAMYEKAVAQQQAFNLKNDLVERLQTLQRRFKEMDFQSMVRPTVSIEGAEDMIMQMRTKLAALPRLNESAWTSLDQYLFPLQAQDNILKKDPTFWSDRAAHDAAQANATQVTIQNLQHAITHAKSHNGEPCPNCQQPMDVASMQQVLQQLQLVIGEQRQRANLSERALKFYRAAKALPFKTFAEYENQKRAWEKSLTSAQTILEQWREIGRKKAERDQVEDEGKRVLAQIEKIQPVGEEEYSAPETYKKFAEDIRTQIVALNSAIEKKEKLRDFDPKWERPKVQREIETLNRHISDFQPRVTAIQQRLQTVTMDYAAARSTYADLVRLNTKIKELEAVTKDAEILEHMREAFGPKGLRRNRVAVLAETFIMYLNRYAPLVYGEKMVFQMVMGEREFDITATRNNGKTSDVRLLSGSEDKAFRLLSLLAILPFIPDAYRTNLVVLDEMESGLDPVSKKLFVQEFLPMLNRIIPNIVIITPQSEAEFYVPNARTIVVEKRKGVSTLNKGNASWSPSSSASPTPTPSNSRTTRRTK